MANTPRTQSALLDHFSIFTNSGLVLWSRTFASANSGTSTGLPAFDSMIKEKIIDTDPLTQTAQQLNHQEAETNIWEGQGCTVRWVTENVHGLIFAVAYPRILTLAYIPTLLSTIKQLFVSLFEPLIQALIAAISGQDMSQLPLSVKKKLFSPGGWQNIWKGWEETFIETCIELQGRQVSLIAACVALHRPDILDVAIKSQNIVSYRQRCSSDKTFRASNFYKRIYRSSSRRGIDITECICFQS